MCAVVLRCVNPTVSDTRAQHDASHTSIGHKPWNWAWLGRITMDWFAGASFTSWHNQHIVGHHLHTNILGADPVWRPAPR